MSKEVKELEQDDQIVIVNKADEKLESFIEDDGVSVSEVIKKKKSNVSVAVDKFDWDAFEKEDVYDTEKSVIEGLYDQTLSKVSENEVVEGTVVSINKREVIVNIGYKSEGVISINEFRYNPELAPGDKVEVYVENAEDKKRSADSFAQESTLAPFLGQGKRGIRQR